MFLKIKSIENIRDLYVLTGRTGLYSEIYFRFKPKKNITIHNFTKANIKIDKNSVLVIDKNNDAIKTLFPSFPDKLPANWQIKNICNLPSKDYKKEPAIFYILQKN